MTQLVKMKKLKELVSTLIFTALSVQTTFCEHVPPPPPAISLSGGGPTHTPHFLRMLTSDK